MPPVRPLAIERWGLSPDRGHSPIQLFQILSGRAEPCLTSRRRSRSGAAGI